MRVLRRSRCLDIRVRARTGAAAGTGLFVPIEREPDQRHCHSHGQQRPFRQRPDEDDFDIYEDGVLQQTSHFDAERVPVSLGLAVDTSGSMVGDKWEAAQAALGRFLNDLLGSQDEVFLYRFRRTP